MIAWLFFVWFIASCFLFVVFGSCAIDARQRGEWGWMTLFAIVTFAMFFSADRAITYFKQETLNYDHR